ncbi:MAG: carboxylate-amine ligase [Planctomycetes bacterium]|nr:carboxylate-amine ligase [Planctomycetota bacterium]MBI3846563.1 carboxylate-amine ligase [Planctomycetota bacterium]
MPTFTLGVEEEFQIVDPETRELRSHVQQMFEQGRVVLQERIRPELHQSVIEVGTGVCKDVGCARHEITDMRAALAKIARENGLRIAAAGTHPFSHWADVPTTSNPRYDKIIADFQTVARANLIFGLHVHVGIEDRNALIHVMNAARYFLPHLLAISTNSPFWLGRDSGWKSYRTKVFDKFPRTNIPDAFTSWSEYEDFVKLLVKTNCIEDGKKIWWDIRPHPHFSTLEYRICDIPMRLDETVALVALIQAITAKLYRLLSKNLTFRVYTRALLMENKWRAARWGLSGKLIDFGKQEEVDTVDLIDELLDFVDDVLDELGSRSEVGMIRHIVARGTGADRQLEVFKKTGDFKKVVDMIIKETEHGLPLD